MKTNKKEQLLFVTRIYEILFCVAIIGSMVYYLLNGQTAMPLLLIKQWIALDAFVFIGLLLGATDVVVRTRKSLVRTLIVAVVLYLVGILLLSKLIWNPFGNTIKFFGTTFLYILVVFVFYQIYQMWKKSSSKAYMKLVENLKSSHPSLE